MFDDRNLQDSDELNELFEGLDEDGVCVCVILEK